METLEDQPKLLRAYLETSLSNTFSELMFRLTHEVYAEDKAADLWRMIAQHRADLKERLGRDMGMLVAALDYLSNISGDMLNPKIMSDVRIEEAATMATRDPLTGLYLRGVFDFTLERMVSEHLRRAEPISLLMLDIDDFKSVNDLCGHQTGDAVLRDMGTIILSSIRSTDFASRYGGEEIAIILLKTPISQAAAFGDMLRERVQRKFAQDNPPVTVSVGVASVEEPTAATAVELVRRADDALYAAKAAGKNRMESCGQP
jgi:diguanylate cyclase (GGDEF)-like protein